MSQNKTSKYKNHYQWLKNSICFLTAFFGFSASTLAFELPSSYAFPIENYDQTMGNWINGVNGMNKNNLLEQILISDSAQKTPHNALGWKVCGTAHHAYRYHQSHDHHRGSKQALVIQLRPHCLWGDNHAR